MTGKGGKQFARMRDFGANCSGSCHYFMVDVSQIGGVV